MKLPIPIFHNGTVYEEVEATKPKAGVLADTAEYIEKGDVFNAMLAFISGSVTEIKADKPVVEKGMIKTLIRRLPFRSAEVLAINILMQLSVDDGIEGIYECPLCHEKIYAIKDEESETDTRDFIRNIPLKSMPSLDGNYADEFVITLQDPIEIKDARSGQPLEIINSITMRHPTLQDTIRAYNKQGNSSTIKRQFAIYAEALEKIGDEEVDNPLRNLWGMYIFEKMDVASLNEIGSIVAQYGMSGTVEKVCKECGRKWNAELDTSNFFVSGLRSG